MIVKDVCISFSVFKYRLNALLIFNYATSPYQDWQNLAWGASLLLAEGFNNGASLPVFLFLGEHKHFILCW